jgi:hypothetical protein
MHFMPGTPMEANLNLKTVHVIENAVTGAIFDSVKCGCPELTLDELRDGFGPGPQLLLSFMSKDQSARVTKMKALAAKCPNLKNYLGDLGASPDATAMTNEITEADVILRHADPDGDQEDVVYGARVQKEFDGVMYYGEVRALHPLNGTANGRVNAAGQYFVVYDYNDAPTVDTDIGGGSLSWPGGGVGLYGSQQQPPVTEGSVSSYISMYQEELCINQTRHMEQEGWCDHDYCGTARRHCYERNSLCYGQGWLCENVDLKDLKPMLGDFSWIEPRSILPRTCTLESWKAGRGCSMQMPMDFLNLDMALTVTVAQCPSAESVLPYFEVGCRGNGCVNW